MTWKRPWGKKKPPKDESYLCVFNDGGKGDDHMNVGVAHYDEFSDRHFILPEWLNIDCDVSMRWWKELPEPPKEKKRK